MQFTSLLTHSQSITTQPLLSALSPNSSLRQKKNFPAPRFSRRETKKKTSINRLRKKGPSMLVFSMTMVYASSRGKASVCLQPVGSFADLGYQRNAQRGHHALHTRANQLADFCSFGTEHVEVQFVMHLQDHTAL